MSDKLAREKVGQALRDSLKSHRTSLAPTRTKKSHNLIHSKASATKSPPSNLMPVKNTSTLGSTDVGNAMRGPIPDEFVSFQPRNFLMQSLQHADPADRSNASQPSMEGISSSFRSDPFVRFTQSNCGGADLEPRRVEQFSNFMPPLSGTTPDNAFHESLLQRQEQCFSLLEAYRTSDHDDTRSQFPNIVQNFTNANISNTSRSVTSPPYVNANQQHFQALSMLGGAFGGNNSIPSIEQQILPTVIESRQLLAGIDFDGDLGRANPLELGNTAVSIPRNNFANQRMEAESKVQGVEGGDFIPQRDNNLYLGEFHVSRP